MKAFPITDLIYLYFICSESIVLVVGFLYLLQCKGMLVKGSVRGVGFGLGIGKIRRLDTKVQGPSMIGKGREFAESGERKEIDQPAGKIFSLFFFFSCFLVGGGGGGGGSGGGWRSKDRELVMRYGEDTVSSLTPASCLP